MTGRSDATPFPTAEPYAPQLRTALVLTGTGAAGVYHAGVLRALDEAGVKLDVVAGRGVGVIGALFAAIDGAQRLWEDKGFWRTPGLRSLYRWRGVAQVVAWALALSVAIVAMPMAVMVAGLVVFPLDFLLRIVGVGGASGLVGGYLRIAQDAFATTALPTWLPRLVFVVLAAAAAIAGVNGWLREGRRGRGAAWWRVAARRRRCRRRARPLASGACSGICCAGRRNSSGRAGATWPGDTGKCSPTISGSPDSGSS